MKKDVEIMKLKYMIGFLSLLLMFTLFLSAGYRITYNNVLEKQKTLEKQVADTRSVQADTGLENNDREENGEGYYLCELQGFVAVYLKDRTTLYELTEIAVSDLPEEMQSEIASGKYIDSQQELYGFLENYSS